ncbi:hypothetical protein NQ314_002570 [Rhamnusium bicolor]|uniref:Cytochrome P450 n=1 Tax=Rhamnusium bicolor TaxID=1586634 RepID=A0AAV8ZRA9_9CUCU|nr:hypothetical protein NQ314_002570 [Rhamnusium bicolor]
MKVLRKWPIVLSSDRLCSQSYTIQPSKSDEKPVHIEKGTVVMIPIFGLHRDAQYYPDPERFDPERFSEQNKDNLNTNSYLPFGAGPRGCIGNKISLLQVKTIFYHVLTHFEVVPCRETRIPIELNRKSITLMCEGKVWLGLKPIIKSK